MKVESLYDRAFCGIHSSVDVYNDFRVNGEVVMQMDGKKTPQFQQLSTVSPNEYPSGSPSICDIDQVISFTTEIHPDMQASSTYISATQEGETATKSQEAKNNSIPIRVPPPRAWKHVRLNKFVRRFHEMLVEEKDKGIVEWRKGLLVLHSTEAFAKSVLPNFFNTRNFKTFRRQLNYYGFVHVRSFSTVGSTTTALWANQDLAKRGTRSISSVLLLKRVDPCPVTKTAEGRRLKKEEAASFVVRDINIPSRNFQFNHIKNLMMRSIAHQDPAIVLKHTFLGTLHAPLNSEFGDSTSEVTSPFEGSEVSLDRVAQSQPILPNPWAVLSAQATTVKKSIVMHHHKHERKELSPTNNEASHPSTVAATLTSSDDVANMLLMLSRSPNFS